MSYALAKVSCTHATVLATVLDPLCHGSNLLRLADPTGMCDIRLDNIDAPCFLSRQHMYN